MVTLWASGNGVYSWTVTPIAVNGRVAAYLAWELKVGGGSTVEQMFSELAGQRLLIHLRSADGSVFARHPGIPVPAPEVIDERQGRPVYAFPEGPALMAEAPVPGTSLVIAVATPLEPIGARARATTGALALASLLLLLLGTAGAWLLSRRIIRPLAAVSRETQS